jgi:hypothetical protein
MEEVPQHQWPQLDQAVVKFKESDLWVRSIPRLEFRIEERIRSKLKDSGMITHGGKTGFNVQYLPEVNCDISLSTDGGSANESANQSAIEEASQSANQSANQSDIEEANQSVSRRSEEEETEILKELTIAEMNHRRVGDAINNTEEKLRDLKDQRERLAQQIVRYKNQHAVTLAARAAERAAAGNRRRAGG